MDDLAEFLHDTYRPFLDALARTGWSSWITAGAPGAYLLLVRTPDGDVEVTPADNTPLPAHPHDVTRWRVYLHGHSRTTVGGAVEDLIRGIAAITATR